jgi:hypothetical protein
MLFREALSTDEFIEIKKRDLSENEAQEVVTLIQPEVEVFRKVAGPLANRVDVKRPIQEAERKRNVLEKFIAFFQATVRYVFAPLKGVISYTFQLLHRIYLKVKNFRVTKALERAVLNVVKALKLNAAPEVVNAIVRPLVAGIVTVFAFAKRKTTESTSLSPANVPDELYAAVKEAFYGKNLPVAELPATLYLEREQHKKHKDRHDKHRDNKDRKKERERGKERGRDKRRERPPLTPTQKFFKTIQKLLRTLVEKYIGLFLIIPLAIFAAWGVAKLLCIFFPNEMTTNVIVATLAQSAGVILKFATTSFHALKLPAFNLCPEFMAVIDKDSYKGWIKGQRG